MIEGLPSPASLCGAPAVGPLVWLRVVHVDARAAQLLQRGEHLDAKRPRRKAGGERLCQSVGKV